MRAMLIAAVLLAVALAGAQAQQMYRWVDKDGRVHYTQQQPLPDAKDVQRRSTASRAPQSPELPYATRLAAKNFPVTPVIISRGMKAAIRVNAEAITGQSTSLVPWTIASRNRLSVSEPPTSVGADPPPSIPPSLPPSVPAPRPISQCR